MALVDLNLRINSLVQTLRNSHDAIQHAYLPKNLCFLKKGYKSHLEPGNLTIGGRQELFNHGVNIRTYSAFWTLNNNMLVTQVSKEWSDIYLPEITARLNELLPDVDLTDDYACAYDLAARDESPWCNVFHADELANFQYELDLGMDVGVGYLAPNDSARVAGSVFVNKLIERFTNTSEEAPSLYLEFGHDATILVAMDLDRDASPAVFTRTTPAPEVPNLVSNTLCCQHDLGKFHLR
ncbi:histidine phosphatase superfamily [Suillus ampliporus]|nr:histidine phosphatase superfamily [Suillus ampliporus]